MAGELFDPFDIWPAPVRVRTGKVVVLTECALNWQFLREERGPGWSIVLAHAPRT
jgi:hypothetical protein